MDETEAEPANADLTRAVREYVWFAIAFICVMGFVVVNFSA